MKKLAQNTQKMCYIPAKMKLELIVSYYITQPPENSGIEMSTFCYESKALQNGKIVA